MTKGNLYLVRSDDSKVLRLLEKQGVFSEVIAIGESTGRAKPGPKPGTKYKKRGRKVNARSEKTA